MSEFERALANVLVHEGGYVNNPKDPGGETNRGITKRVYDAYRKLRGLPAQSVKLISAAEVSEIYRAQYWSKVGGDSLPAGISYVVFDGAVNSGVAQSVKWMQKALAALGLYKGVVDGIIGQGTLAAVAQVNDNDALVARICDLREAFVRHLKTFATFGRGWLSRIGQVRRTGYAWATGSIAAPVTFIAGANAKAVLTDATSAPTTAVADAMTGGGIGSGSLSGIVNQLQTNLSPFSETSSLVSKIVVGLILFGAVLTVAGLAYRWYVNRRKAERTEALDIGVPQPPEAAT
jgi:lysozyme family protein